jgi:hypothetical protein
MAASQVAIFEETIASPSPSSSTLLKQTEEVEIPQKKLGKRKRNKKEEGGKKEEEDELENLEAKLLILINKRQKTNCSCKTFIFPEKNKKNVYQLYCLNIKELQKETSCQFSHLSYMYSELIKHPNQWFARPQMADKCCVMANKMKNSFLNSLSIECKTILNKYILKKSIIKIPDNEIPKVSEEGTLILAKKKEGYGKSTYYFQYYKPACVS